MGALKRWKWVRGYKGLYRVSRDGEVESVERTCRSKGESLRSVPARAIKPFLDAGYWCVNLCKNGRMKKYGVHRLIAVAFVPNPKRLPEVCHRNDVKTDNRIQNLVWGTRAGNARMAKENGRLKSNHTPQVISDEDVQQVKRLLLFKIPRKTIAQWFNISYYTVTDIALGRTRKHIAL